MFLFDFMEIDFEIVTELKSNPHCNSYKWNENMASFSHCIWTVGYTEIDRIETIQFRFGL